VPKGFSEAEKEDIRNSLIAQCKKSWSVFGYKKTNIADLCAKVGISTGGFYLFFESKEALFCEVMDDFQKSTRLMFEEMLSSPPTKDEICQALKKLYLEYAENNIITKRHGPDYISLLNKLPKEWREKHSANSDENLASTLFASGVKLKMSKKKAKSIINTLLLTVANKDIIHNHYEVFCILLDCVVNEIYE